MHPPSARSEGLCEYQFQQPCIPCTNTRRTSQISNRIDVPSAASHLFHDAPSFELLNDAHVQQLALYEVINSHESTHLDQHLSMSFAKTMRRKGKSPGSLVTVANAWGQKCATS